MTSANIGMLVNHQEIDHLITAMSDSLRNAAYKVANEIAPKGSPKYHEFFDEGGTLLGYDIDSNKALLRDCLDHYVQFVNTYGGTERTDFNYYLETNFDLVRTYVNANPEVMAYLTSLFASACGILASVLQPVMENILNRGQMIDRIESYVTGPENTYYLVYGDDIDNPETYDSKEDDLSDVDVSQSPEVLERLSAVDTRRREDDKANDAWGDYSTALFNAMNEPGALLNHLVKARYRTIAHRQNLAGGQPTPEELDSPSLREHSMHLNQVLDSYDKVPNNSDAVKTIISQSHNLVWNAPGTELL